MEAQIVHSPGRLPSADFDAELGVLRLRTLVRLRWLAVTGQTAAVLGVHLVLGFPLPLGFCLAAIALSGLAQHLPHHQVA